MTIQQLAHDLASRVPAMAQDSPINNAHLIEKMIEACFAESELPQINAQHLPINSILVVRGMSSPAVIRWVEHARQALIKAKRHDVVIAVMREGESLETLSESAMNANGWHRAILEKPYTKGTGGCYCDCLPCQSCDHR